MDHIAYPRNGSYQYKHICQKLWLYHIVDKQKKNNYLLFENWMVPLIVVPFHTRMLCAMFGWNWPSGSGEGGFFNVVNVFSLLSPLGKGCGPSL